MGVEDPLVTEIADLLAALASGGMSCTSYWLPASADPNAGRELSPVAHTAINLDGDSQVYIPTGSEGKVDSSAWEQHQRNLEAAMTHLRQAIDCLTSAIPKTQSAA